MKSNTLTAFSALPPHWVIDTAFGADLAARLLAFVLERDGLYRCNYWRQREQNNSQSCAQFARHAGFRRIAR